jgi:hypothetical protein
MAPRPEKRHTDAMGEVASTCAAVYEDLVHRMEDACGGKAEAKTIAAKLLGHAILSSKGGNGISTDPGPAMGEECNDVLERALQSVSSYMAANGDRPESPANQAIIDAVAETIARRNTKTGRRSAGGVVFTARPEIEFMCRLAVTTYYRHGNENDVLLAFTDHPPKILDPACGSGAFLTGMLDLFEQILSRSSENPPGDGLAYRRLAEFASTCLFGHDVDPAAVELAKARLQAWFSDLPCRHPGWGIHEGTVPSFEATVSTADFLAESGNSYDIIIGNPPYLRQEDISGQEGDGQYKQSLHAIDAPISKERATINGMSDYFVYFFLKGIEMLDPGGILCLITSNSWLDSKYGEGLQEFLLSNQYLLFVHDAPARSFLNAEINTVITTCTKRLDDDGTDDVRFVRFHDPLGTIPPEACVAAGEVCNTVARGQDLHARQLNVSETGVARVFSVDPDDLRKNIGKWSSKFLNTHGIYYDLVGHVGTELCLLEDIAAVRAGCYTGINDFFYPNDETIRSFGIDAGHLMSIIRNQGDIDRLDISTVPGHRVLVVPPIPLEELRTQAWSAGTCDYIEWGASQVTRTKQKTRHGIPWPDVPSVRNRTCWYALPDATVAGAHMFMQYIAHDRFYCPWSEVPMVSDRSFHRVFPGPEIDARSLQAILNSTPVVFWAMSAGRSNLGAGALKFEVRDARRLPVLDPRRLGHDILNMLRQAAEEMGKRRPLPVFAELGIDPKSPVASQEPSPIPDRKRLDDIFFDQIGFSPEQRVDLYRATCSLVKDRLTKARTFSKEKK